MKNKMNHFDFMIGLLFFVQAILFLGISVVLYFNAPNPLLTFVLIAASFGIALLTNLYYANFNRKKELDYTSELKRSLDLIRNDEKWTNPAGFYGEEMQTVFDSLEKLYNSLREKEAARTRALNMVNTVTSNMETEKLFEALMPKLVESMNSHWGAFYLANQATGKLELKSALGFSKNIYTEFDIALGEGLIGCAANRSEITVLRDVPTDTFFVTKTFLGKVNPKNIMIVPVSNNDQLIGTLCLASVYDYTGEQMEIINMLQYYLGIALGNCVIYERAKRLTNELQFQNSLIQSLNEELENKVSDRNLFLKNIIDSITDYAIYVIDKDGIILEWNRGAELLLGYMVEEVKGQHINIVYLDEEVRAGKVRRRMDMVKQHGQMTEKGWRYKKDGSKYYSEMSLFGLYNDRNELIGMTNVSKDITKLKIAENEIWFQKEFARTLIEGSGRALLITDGEGNIQFGNQMALRLLQIQNIVGQKVWDYIESDKLLNRLGTKAQDAAADIEVRVKATGDVVLAKLNVAKDELSIMETFVFFFYPKPPEETA